MFRDFAKRSKPAKRTRKKRRKATPARSALFHGPSFSFGAVLGALVIIAAVYLPDYVETQTQQVQTSNPGSEKPPAMTFEFPDRLKKAAVTAAPDDYPVPQTEADPSAPVKYVVQAASFEIDIEADQLRAGLLLQGLPATSVPTQVAGKPWFRVMVGPYDRRVEAQRALTNLRNQGFDAIILTQRTTG